MDEEMLVERRKLKNKKQQLKYQQRDKQTKKAKRENTPSNDIIGGVIC